MSLVPDEIVTLKPMVFAGMRQLMSLADDQTPALCRRFMPVRKQIILPEVQEIFLLKIFPDGYFQQFNPNARFEKFIGMHVSSEDSIPEGMELIKSPAGQYALFHHAGMENVNELFQRIYTVWLPQSSYVLDDRPHFDRLPADYRFGDPNAEEDFFIPVRIKQ